MIQLDPIRKMVRESEYKIMCPITSEYEISYNCYAYMAGYIFSMTSPYGGPTSSIPSLDRALRDAATKVEIGNPASPECTLTIQHYILWTNVLRRVHHWPDRYYRHIKITKYLWDILEDARDIWLSCGNQAKPTDRESAFLNEMVDSLFRSTVIIPQLKSAKVALWKTAVRSGLLGLDDNTLEFGNQDFVSWSAKLKDTYRWADGPDSHLWKQLAKARDQFLKCKRPGQPPIPTIAEPPKPNDQLIHLEELMPQKPKEREEKMTHTSFSTVAIQEEGGGLRSQEDHIFRQCDFCGKETIVPSRTGEMLKKLAGPGFYCPFCVRHEFNTRRRRHVMVLTFRGLIGYMYNFCYYGKKPKLYLTQLHDLINQHVMVGHLNPVFTYDCETFCWFVDFSKVGTSRRKVKVDEVLRTVNEIISAFNPFEIINDFKSNVLTGRFEEATMDFYKKRYRPEGKKICAPTMFGCATDMRESVNGNVTSQKKVDIKKYRDFLPIDCKPHQRR